MGGRTGRIIQRAGLVTAAVTGMGAAATRVLPPRAIPVQPSATPACAPADDPGASSVLNCMTLVAVPDLPGASGIIHLRPIPTPFGVAVLPDGRPRYRLVATISGLPEPRTLGEFGTYVAWAYTVALDSAVKLGPVTNGVVPLGELSYVQFRILITAERSTSVTERGRR